MHVARRPMVESAAFSFAVEGVGLNEASLTAAGELDLAAAEDLAAIMTAQEAAGRTFIRLDLSAVTFMDCAFLRVLVGAHHRLTATRGRLLLTNVSDPVLRLLTLTELTERLLTAGEPETLDVGVSA